MEKTPAVNNNSQVISPASKQPDKVALSADANTSQDPPTPIASPAEGAEGSDVVAGKVEDKANSFILTRSIKIQANNQLIQLDRGEVVDDPFLLAKIRDACDPVPLRPLNVLDLVDRS